MKLRRRGIAALMAVLAGAAAASNHDLRLAVTPAAVSLPVYVAEARGYFEQEGVSVRILDCPTGRGCLQHLQSGQADVATASELVVVTEGPAALDPVIFATISSSARHIKLVARRSAGIAKPEDLRGKRVATVRGSSAQYFLDNWLVYYNIEPGQVQIIGLPHGQIAAALQGAQVDAVAIWGSVAGSAAAALGSDALVFPNPGVYKQHFNLVARRRLIADREAVLVRLLRALDRASRAIAESPAEARRILIARLPKQAGVDLSEHDYGLKLEQSLIVTMDAELRWAQQQGQAASGARTEPLLRRIETAPLRKVSPDAVSLMR